MTIFHCVGLDHCERTVAHIFILAAKVKELDDYLSKIGDWALIPQLCAHF
jgi:hypothetical protein